MPYALSTQEPTFPCYLYTNCKWAPVSTYRALNLSLKFERGRAGLESVHSSGFSQATMLDVSRIQKELTEIERDKKTSGISIKLCGDSDLAHLCGTISGPVGTPYEGGLFQIDIRLPGAYPFEPPKMQFLTKVWHPNISSQNGAICLDILKDQWSPALTLKTALLSLQALLSAPEPDDPQDAVVAQQYRKDYATFESTAHYWTEAFAKGANLGMEEKVQKLVEMGFAEDRVRTTLEKCGGDENMALEKLCSG